MRTLSVDNLIVPFLRYLNFLIDYVYSKLLLE